VLGDNRLAREKAELLRAAGAQVREHAQRQPGDLLGVRLVIDASGDEELNRGVWAEAEERGILVNVLDRPERCRFIAPALVNRDPLLIAISTSGESPFLAAALRLRLESWLGAEWGPFVRLLGEVRRRLRQEGAALADQVPVYRRLLNSPLLALLRAGRAAEGTRLADSIAGAVGSAQPGRVALVGAGPGAPELLTVAARELLLAADIIFHDALVGSDILALANPQAERIDVGKRGGRVSTEQSAIHQALVEAARAGKEVVRLKGGDPYVFGRGGEEALALAQAGVEVLVVPGVSSALAAPAAAGIPVTMRGVASSFAVATAHSSDALGPRLEALARSVDTLVLMMPLADLKRTAARLEAVLGGNRPAALVCSATTPAQSVLRSSLAQIAAAASAGGVRGPAVLVVGEVVQALAAAQGLMAASTSPIKLR